MSMNELLANYYGTNGSGQAEELEKQAQVELFAKLASDNGIDLNELNDEQVQGLWDSTFKTAGDDEDKDKDEKKKEEAKEEFAEKKESADKLAEADFLGRTMAHAYVDELNKIAEGPSTWEKVKGHAKAVGGHVSDAATGRSARAGWEYRKHTGKGTEARGVANKMLAKGVGKTLGLAAAVGGAGYGAKKVYDKHKNKEGSALDEVAADFAVEKAAEAGFDPEEAANRVGALLTLGVEDSEKVASAEDFESAVEVRALEFLEKVGYSIEWADLNKEAADEPGVARKAWEKTKGYARAAGGHVSDAATAGSARAGWAGRKASQPGSTERAAANKMLAKGVGKTLGLAAAVGGAGYGAKKLYDKHKEGSFEDLSGELAVEKAAEAGFDPEEAAERVSAVLTLGVGGSEKVASAQSFESAIDTYSLELLEAAGYQINWA